ncbi:MAG TPA: ATP-dependent DNA helicase RecQ [Candidatus Polarisedimenticolia bacterium]|nr:ATP-dependent DNA helicase RecQ [Candidatus Polarisedimenticolia bacterium]
MAGIPSHADPQQILESVFGYREFRPGQRHIIDAVLSGRDCIGVMPTGAGKSLTFQIPARILPGTVLVISPLISLMKDQVDELVRLGFRAAVINSTLDHGERRQRLGRLRRGELELVYVAPEGIEGSMGRFIAEAAVSLVVVDEAHCISHWGHDFRPAYRKLRRLKEELGDIPVLALTATATRPVVGDIIRQLGMRKPDGFKGSFFRPNLHITAQKRGQGRNTRADILGLIRRHDGESGIVYCLGRKGVESTAAWLRLQGINAAPYHAGLEPEARTAAQDAFARDEIDVIVATVAFGMGIDKSNVRFVIHRDMPKSVEAWYQEMGRAGRDGLPSDCILMYSWADVIGYDRFLAGIEDEAVRTATRRKTVEMFELADRPGCRHQAVTAYLDERIDPCGGSCDHCRGAGLEALVAPVKTIVPRQKAALACSGPADPALFEKLRTLRKRIADEEGVPAYIVFSDAVLQQMAAHVPTSRSALLALSGVGPVKLERYGERFLRILEEH